jgi:hypothetical protein
LARLRSRGGGGRGGEVFTPLTHASQPNPTLEAEHNNKTITSPYKFHSRHYTAHIAVDLPNVSPAEAFEALGKVENSHKYVPGLLYNCVHPDSPTDAGKGAV